MDGAEQIKKFEDFLNVNYQTEILKRIHSGHKSTIIDFVDLSRFDLELAESLLDSPDDAITAVEIATEQFDLPKTIKRMRIRFINLPDSQKIMIRDIRSEHINKLMVMEGVVRQKSDVRPQVITSKFECPSCGAIISVLQLDSKFKEPTRCGCGRKGKFRLLSKKMVDAQGLVLEEAPEDLEGGEQPKRMNVFLKEDLVSPITEKKTNPGSKIRIAGQVKEVPIILKTGGQSTRFDLVIEANSVEGIEEDYSNLEISEEEQKKIKELSQDPKVYEKVIQSVAPKIYGLDKIKEALILQLVGGVRKHGDDGSLNRGDMHVLLVGDPGCGKCVTGNTKIVLGDGSTHKISDLINPYFSGLKEENKPCKLKVPSMDFDGSSSIKDASRVWKRRYKGNLLKINTNTGNQIIITPNHPFFVAVDCRIVGVSAKSLRVGDYLASPNTIKTMAVKQHICSYFKRSKARNKKAWTVPKECDDDFASMCGYLAGDGYVSFSKTSGWVSLTNNDKELLDDFSDKMKILFDRKLITRKPHRGKSAEEIYLISREIVSFLKNTVPEIVRRSADKSVPQIINKSPNQIVACFIRSLFDCDGYVCHSKREVSLCSKSKELIDNIRLLLLRFGILSQIRKTLKCATNTQNKTKSEYFVLCVSGRNFIRFHEQIGALCLRKKKRLEILSNSKTKLNNNLDIIPNISFMLKVLRKKYKKSQFSFKVSRSTYRHLEKGDRLPSKKTLLKVLESYDKNDSLVKCCLRFAKADIFWDKVKSIEIIKDSDIDVFDFQVDHVHNFVADGFFVHNSQLLKRMSFVAPKARFVSGKGASGAGLTAAVVKDEFLRGWSLEAGALVLANKGICMIDEMDKMSHEDRSAMHEALEQQTVTISKANIQATLRCETTVLAAANPKFGRFDPYSLVGEQIDLPPTLINRFDLIFPVKDLPDPTKDAKLAEFILSLHQSKLNADPPLETKFLRKFIAYAKQNCKPVLSDEAVEKIKKYYVDMRSSGGDDKVRSVPISARQLEGLVRLSEASAKLRLSDVATVDDAQRAIELLEYCLNQVARDQETGRIDIDRISTGISAAQRSGIYIIKEIIANLENKLGKTIPIEDILKFAEEKGLSPDKVEEIIEKLKRSGDIFEPKHGFISRI